MKILFILDHALMHYRVPLFNILILRGFKITVIHSGNFIKECNFEQIVVKETKILKIKYKAIENLNKYDVVIQMQNLHYLNVWLNTLNPFRKFKLIDWTIGSSSQGGLTDSVSLADKIRNFLSKFNDHIILYSEFGKSKYSHSNQRKLTIANNTIFNPIKEDLSRVNKDSFMFIGSLNERKGVDQIIYSFHKYINSIKNPKIKYLQIIGTGNQLDYLKNLVSDLHIKERVFFHGNVVDFTIKKNIFSRSIANISPNQAGLSVLESFSFGVPFITKNNAISGGEHLNIVNNQNGFLYDVDDELTSLLLFSNHNNEKLIKLGQNAYLHYVENRNYDLFVDSFVNAIISCKEK